MKFLLFLSISTCLFISALAQGVAPKRKTDREISDWKGPIHILRIERVILEDPEKIGLFSGWLPSQTVFDREGNLTEYVVHDEKGEIKEKTVIEKDRNGRKIKESRVKPDGTPIHTFLYRYDENGNQTESDVLGADGSFLHGTRRSFDGQGKLISYSNIEENGAVDCTIEIVTDKNGNRLKESRRCQREWSSGDVVYEHSETEEGKRVESRDFSMKGTLSGRYVYLWDKSGNSTELQYDGEDKLVRKETCEYSGHDSHGNWTTEIRNFWIMNDGKLMLNGKTKTTRTITYY